MRTLLLPGLLLLAGAGCAAPGAAPLALSPHAGHHAPADIGGSVPAGERVAVVSELSSREAAQGFAFRLYDAEARELRPDGLAIAHEKLLHLLVVRDDYEEFHHVHPEYLDGAWRVKIPFEAEGAYQAYVDADPEDGEPFVLRKELRVGAAPARPPRLVARDVVQAEGYEVSVSPLMGADGVEFAFAIRKDGVQVADVGPYLGAYGHVVMLKSGDPDGFVHMHPITESAPADGIVRFGSALPAAGSYPMYAQFSLGGKILTFPFVLQFGP